jgi:hypothetical protein
MIVLIAKLERGICLIVYFGFKSYCSNIVDPTMTTINKIYLQVLVQLLQRENLICSFIWIFQLAMSAVCIIRHCSQEVKKDLASKQRLCNPKTDYESNYTAPTQSVTRHKPLRRITVRKRSYTQQSCSQTALLVKMLCSYLTQKNSYLIRLFFIRLPLQQESGA